MSDFTFTVGKSALITGGASGIDLALAHRCVHVGMQVLIADIKVESLESAKEMLGDRVSTAEMDVGKEEDWKRLRQTVKED